MKKNKVRFDALDSKVVVDIDEHSASQLRISVKAIVARDEIEEMINLLRQAVRVFDEDVA